MDAKSALGRVTSALHVGGYEATRVAAMAGLCQELAAGIETGENQNEEPGLRSDDAGSGGGLGEMTRRKREIVGLTNERDFPHLVELALVPGGFRSVFLEFDAFHRERRIPLRRGRSREAEQLYI
jgi:hypothetical protein